MDITTFNLGLPRYLDTSPTPFHAVRSATQLLDDGGFTALD